jgi:RNA polymerase sigma factor for flagellar operon FliA
MVPSPEDKSSQRGSPAAAGADSPEVRARFEEGLALVPMVVKQMNRHLAQVRTEEVTSFAQEGALLAARTYDAELGVPFRRWASVKIRGTVLDGLRSQAGLPRSLYRKLRGLHELVVAQDGMDLDTPLNPHKVSPAQADAKIADRLAAMATALAMRKLSVELTDAVTGIVDPAPSPEEELAGAQLRAAVRAAMNERPEAERRLLERYYFEDATLEEAADGLSRSWASRLHARALVGLAKTLQRAKLPG